MLAARELTLGYRDLTTLSGFTHTFPSGSFTTITGRSGCGKSTLLYALGLLLRPLGGDVLVGGRATSSLGDRLRSAERAATIGFVFQDAMLDPRRTVVDNVRAGALYAGLPEVAATARAEDLLDRIGVTGRHHHRPGEISGGQAQRVALCRALIKRPMIVLADEPTGNLDRETGSAIWRVLGDEASRGAAVIVATHDPTAVPSATDRIEL